MNKFENHYMYNKQHRDYENNMTLSQAIITATLTHAHLFNSIVLIYRTISSKAKKILESKAVSII